MQKKKILLSFFLCIFFLTGCSCAAIPQTSNTEKTTVIKIWHYYNGKQKDSFEALVHHFNETAGSEKGILVTTESKGSVDELSIAITESADEKVGADLLPDVVATYADTALVLFNKGILTDISQYLTEEELSAYVPSFLEEGRLTGESLEILPVAKSTELLFLNATDWEPFAKAAGVSETSLETWEGLLQTAEAYYEWSGGKTFFGRDAFANYLIVGSMQLGSPLFHVTNQEVTLQMDEAVLHRLWDYYAVPYLKGYYGALGRFRSDDVKTGDLIACIASTASVAYYPSQVTKEDGTTYPIDVKVYRVPNFEGTPPYAVQQGAGMAVLKSDEKQEQAAVEFLKWFTDLEQNTRFSAETGYFPVKKAANSPENLKEYMASAGILEDSLSYNNLLMSSLTVEESTLYTNKAFEHGSEARSVLTYYLSDYLDACLEEMNAMLAEGMSTEDVWERYITEDLFQEWLSSLRAKLESVL